MKKILSLILAVAMLLGVAMILGSCGGNESTEAKYDKIPDTMTSSDGKYEVAMVTDVGQLKDKGFNQGTWNGTKYYASQNGKSYKYYAPANGSYASDNDRIAAMRQAVTNGAKIIVAPGYLQATAMSTVAKDNPDVKFVFVDGWALGLKNVTAITYKEQESGYFAGYAAVKEGYRKLGFMGGGGGTNPACNRFGYGFAQGAEAAAKELGLADNAVELQYSYMYGASFSASADLQAMAAGWYAAGTEVIFSCGGSMFDSVKAAAAEYSNAKIIGVDVDQSGESTRVITSAVKGLSVSVEKILGQFYDGKWDTELSDKAQNLGATDDSTGLPTDTWSMKKFTKADYETLLKKVKDGTLTIDADTGSIATDEIAATGFLGALDEGKQPTGYTKVKVVYTK